MAEPAVRDAVDYLHPDTLAQVAGIELRARLIVEGLMTGMHRSPYQGYSIEFAQHRQYAPGDDLRHLDWKVFGRTDKLYLKQYQQETNLDLALIVDASGSMAYGSPTRRGESWRKFDHATAAAAALAYLALHQQDRVGLIVFADRVLDRARPSGSHGQWRAVINALTAQPVDRPTQFRRVVDESLSVLTQKSLVVVISDLFDETGEAGLNSALARLRYRGHDVIVLQTMDHQELAFDFRVPTRFLGLEDEGRIDLDPKALREAYLEALQRHIDEVREVTRRYGYDHALVDTSQSLGPVLSEVLARRAAKPR